MVLVEETSGFTSLTVETLESAQSAPDLAESGFVTVVVVKSQSNLEIEGELVIHQVGDRDVAQVLATAQPPC